MIRSSLFAAMALALGAAPSFASDLPSGFEETIVLDGLESPASFDFLPDGRMMISERVLGHLRIATETPPGSGQWQLSPGPFATFDVPQVGGVPTAHRSSGVRGFAFDPRFQTNGFVYVFYMKDNPRQNRVVRIQADPADPSRALPGETLLIDVPLNSSAASGSHNGGALRFGADGMLYVTTGDGWSGGDLVQSLGTFTGKVLRIRPDGAIPTDNPFYAQASGSYRSIFALGLRNPYTLSFEPSSGWLLIGEANGGNKAEILRLEAGANYRHQGYAGIGVPRGRWVDGAAAGNKLVTGGAWYPPSGPFPAEFHGAYFMALWGTNGANGGPPGQLSYVRSASDPTVLPFATNVGQFDGAGTRLKPVHLRVGPDGALYYLLTSYLTGAGRIVRVRYVGGSTVGAPTITPDGGSFPTPPMVTLGAPTPGSEVRWTVDGSDPTLQSELYAGPLAIRRSGTLKARAFLGATPSAIVSADFIVGSAANQPPIANAGPDQVAAVGTMVVLNGAATHDPDGSQLFLSEQWRQVGGQGVALFNADETAAFFTPTETGRLTFRLDVTDGIDADSDTTIVTVLPCVNDVTDSLVGRWAFEEASGAVALDSAAGLWNGALEGPQWATSGAVIGLGALRFDGAGDRVQLGAPDVSGEALTLAAWIRPDDFGVADARILSKAMDVTEQGHLWMLSTIGAGGATRARFRLKAGGITTTLAATSGDLTSGVWSHVAAVYDGQRMRLFVDGVPAGSCAKSGTIATSPTTPAALGDQPQGGRAFDGLLDEVRVYSRALSAQEVAILARRTRRADCGLDRDPR